MPFEARGYRSFPAELALGMVWQPLLEAPVKKLHCQACGVECERTGPSQRYCQACSYQRNLNRKRRWSNSHSPTEQQAARWRASARQRRTRSRNSGLATNRRRRREPETSFVDEPGLVWMLRVAVPFDYAASKNHIYALTGAGHFALRRESKAKRSEIALAIRQGLGSHKVAHNKVWIDILVQKPNHRGDAVNVVDLVCDAVKDALPVDDRWFCLRRLDWEIVKENPLLIIGVGQETDADAQVCSDCGQIKPLSDFHKSRDRPLGVGRQCRECRRVTPARTAPHPFEDSVSSPQHRAGVLKD